MSNTKSLYLSAALILELLGCEGGASSSSVAADCSAPGSSFVAAVGAPIAGSCVDTAEALLNELEVCVDSEQYQEQHYCVQSRAEGTQYWVRLSSPPTPSQEWLPCEPAMSLAPACAFSTCQATGPNGEFGSPSSTCSPSVTAERYACGDGNSVWDQNCCLRSYCDVDEDCSAGQVCRTGRLYFMLQLCSPAEDSACDCNSPGFEDGPSLRMCFEPTKVPSE
jgi:hypothetical protein